MVRFFAMWFLGVYLLLRSCLSPSLGELKNWTPASSNLRYDLPFAITFRLTLLFRQYEAYHDFPIHDSFSETPRRYPRLLKILEPLSKASVLEGGDRVVKADFYYVGLGTGGDDNSRPGVR